MGFLYKRGKENVRKGVRFWGKPSYWKKMEGKGGADAKTELGDTKGNTEEKNTRHGKDRAVFPKIMCRRGEGASTICIGGG